MLAGGCATNSVANGNITRATPFRRVDVQAAAGDAGGAIGAAAIFWHELMGSARNGAVDYVCWAPQFSDAELSEEVEVRRAKLKMHSRSS